MGIKGSRIIRQFQRNKVILVKDAPQKEVRVFKIFELFLVFFCGNVNLLSCINILRPLHHSPPSFSSDNQPYVYFPVAIHLALSPHLGTILGPGSGPS
jgi:hypothetical protein